MGAACDAYASMFLKLRYMPPSSAAAMAEYNAAMYPDFSDECSEDDNA